MHPSNHRPWKPDKLSQGMHKQASYPRVQWGNTLDNREATELQVSGNPVSSGPERGEHNVKEHQEHRTTHAAGS